MFFIDFLQQIFRVYRVSLWFKELYKKKPQIHCTCVWCLANIKMPIIIWLILRRCERFVKSRCIHAFNFIYVLLCQIIGRFFFFFVKKEIIKFFILREFWSKRKTDVQWCASWIQIHYLAVYDNDGLFSDLSCACKK